MNATLIKIDRNGSKHFEGMMTCSRCDGCGYFAVAVRDMRPVLSPLDAGICWKCHGAGKVFGKWIERTPEYQAKLDAKRKAKQEAEQAKREEEARRLREERARLEAARKAISKHVGNVGDKVALMLTYIGTASWDQPAYTGRGMETHYIHKFEDEAHNVITWKTTVRLGWTDEEGYWNQPEAGDKLNIRGRIKDHTTYNGQKQTLLTRCKYQVA